jgi:hypothetical protein
VATARWTVIVDLLQAQIIIEFLKRSRRVYRIEMARRLAVSYSGVYCIMTCG